MVGEALIVYSKVTFDENGGNFESVMSFDMAGRIPKFILNRFASYMADLTKNTA